MRSTLFRIALTVGLVWSFSSHAGAATDEISDHRVLSLSCGNVTANSVAKALRLDAFDMSHHLPVRNWAFRYGLYDLAGCWSLSRFQRLYFYLREPGRSPAFTDFSNQARSMEMYESENEWKAFPLDKFRFVPDYTDPLWAKWEKGMLESGWSARPLERGLKPDIEYYQALRFHQLENLRYLKGPNERTPVENSKLFAEVQSLLASGRHPLLLLRPDRYYQHVVLAKRIDYTATGATIWVYDSNSPWFERPVQWHRANQMYSAFEIINGMPVPDPRANIGVFIVDQDENERLLESLAAHYKIQCSKKTIPAEELKAPEEVRRN